jgi:hypothetical protein
LATYFKEPRTLAVFRCGPAGSQLDRFIIWLEIRIVPHIDIHGRVGYEIHS